MVKSAKSKSPPTAAAAKERKVRDAAAPAKAPRKAASRTRKIPTAPDPLALLAPEGRVDIKFKAHQAVYSQGDAAEAIYYLRVGRVQVSVVSDQGKEGIIALFGPGDFFGEGCLAGQPLRLASAIATSACTINRIDRGTMARLLRDNREFSDEFMVFLVSRNIQVEADLVDQLFNSSEKRLARLLLLLANFGADHELRAIVPKVSQETLAARVGTTRSRINYFMNKFRRLGLIEYNGSIKVHTALLNVIVHD